MKFSIGHNFDARTLGLLDRHKNHIEAFYFPIPRKYCGSGRMIKEPASYARDITRIIKKCASLKITSQLLVNAAYEGPQGVNGGSLRQILGYIEKARAAGLDSVVVTNPLYISQIKKNIPGIRVETSVNCYLRTVEHALYLQDLGADVLTIDRDINRNIPLIRQIKKRTGLKLRMMLNEGCVSNCPYRVFHYNYLSVDHQSAAVPVDGVFWDKFCVAIYQKDPAKVFRIPFIPPEEVHRYQNCVDYFKLSTRVLPTATIESCLKAYIDRRFSGNLLALLDCPGLAYFEYIDYDLLKSNGYFSRMLGCGLNCRQCGYCRGLLKKAVLVRRGLGAQRDAKEERKSIRFYRKELKRSGDRKRRASAYLRLGDSYVGLNKYGQARESVRRALDCGYKGSQTYTILGLCYEGQKDYRRAAQALKKAAKIDPDDKRINLALTRCYARLGKTALLNREVDKIVRKPG